METRRGPVLRIASVHQPGYLPWAGYFAKMMQADVFCHLDNVQFTKNGWQNRNRIKTGRGGQWLTVPVRHRHPQTIAEVEIDGRTDWARKHLQSLRTNYGRSPFFATVFPALEEVLSRPWRRLLELNLALIEVLRGFLGLEARPAFLASSLPARAEPTERLIDLCRAAGADAYLAGAGALDYLDFARFQAAGIRVLLQRFRPPVYPQRFGAFVPQLSVVDLLFACGPESGRRIAAAAERPLEAAGDRPPERIGAR
ncbi:MAG: WbqC family protein [Desulfobacterales bacterium]